MLIQAGSRKLVNETAKIDTGGEVTIFSLERPMSRSLYYRNAVFDLLQGQPSG